MIETYILLGTLGVHSIEDIRQRQITITITLFSGILGVLLHLIFQNKSIYEMLAGMLPGIFLLAVSLLTSGGIGMGDGMVFMLTGLYLGLAENLFLMIFSFLLAAAAGLFVLAIQRDKGNERLPLVPFLLLAYVFRMIW